MAVRLLSDPSLFARFVVGRPLRRHQLEPARAVLGAVLARRDEVLCVAMARAAGKTELSAHLEAYLLNLNERLGGEVIKALPGCARSAAEARLRLEWALQNPLNFGRWRSTEAAVDLGAARCRFVPLGAGAGSLSPAGSLLLEVDDAQEITPEENDRAVGRLDARIGRPRVYYGVPWRSDDLLARVEERCRAASRRDGVRRHFAYPWWVAAERDPAYARMVEAERARLGDEHPLFRTQYRLMPLEPAEAALLSRQQRGLMRGDHPRRSRPEDAGPYLAGVSAADAGAGPGTAVVTVARVAPVAVADGVLEPRLEVVEHLRLTGPTPAAWSGELVTILRDVWRCARVAVGPAGAGACADAVLRQALGARVRLLEPGAAAGSRACFALLGAVNGGRFKVYRDPAAAVGGDGCAAAFWRQAALCRYAPGRSRQVELRVPGTLDQGDFVLSAALCAWGARDLVAAPTGVAATGEAEPGAG
ncbi:MAG TPA: hypothetical protein VGM69_03165 [Chloroflexota bacterium]|jgi:hypothetical protein